MSSTTYLVLSLLIFACILGIICKLTLLQRKPKTRENFENDYEFRYFTDAGYSTPYTSTSGDNLNWNDGTAPDTACFKQEEGESDKIYRKQVKLSTGELGPNEIVDETPLPRPRCCNADDFEMQYDDSSMTDEKWDQNKFCGTKTRDRVKKESSADCVGGDPNALSSDQKQKKNGDCCDDQNTSYHSKYYSSVDDANNKQNRYNAPGEVPGYDSVPCESMFSYYSQDEKECTDENSGEDVIRVRGDGPVEQSYNNNTPCDVDCVVSGWSGWSECSAPCDGGTQTRTPNITTYTVGNGTPCPAPQTQACNTQPCPVDCQVSEWSAWGECTASCGGGTQTRHRTINTNHAYGGQECPPELEQTQICNNVQCPPVNCDGYWSECDSYGNKTYTRTTEPENNGNDNCPVNGTTVSCYDKIEGCQLTNRTYEQGGRCQMMGNVPGRPNDRFTSPWVTPVLKTAQECCTSGQYAFGECDTGGCSDQYRKWLYPHELGTDNQTTMKHENKWCESTPCQNYSPGGGRTIDRCYNDMKNYKAKYMAFDRKNGWCTLFDSCDNTRNHNQGIIYENNSPNVVQCDTNVPDPTVPDPPSEIGEYTLIEDTLTDKASSVEALIRHGNRGTSRQYFPNQWIRPWNRNFNQMEVSGDYLTMNLDRVKKLSELDTSSTHPKKDSIYYYESRLLNKPRDGIEYPGNKCCDHGGNGFNNRIYKDLFTGAIKNSQTCGVDTSGSATMPFCP